ncbi:MAG: hypothetical protein ABIG11_10640, partial [bacterium]
GLDKNILMKNSYPDKFLFHGLRKYAERAFLRAVVLYRMKDRTGTFYNYNSRIFKTFYVLSALIFGLSAASIAIRPLIWPALASFVIFLYLNRGLYLRFREKYGFIFSVRAALLHCFYIMVVSISGIAGLAYAFFGKEKTR